MSARPTGAEVKKANIEAAGSRHEAMVIAEEPRLRRLRAPKLRSVKGRGREAQGQCSCCSGHNFGHCKLKPLRELRIYRNIRLSFHTPPFTPLIKCSEDAVETDT